VAREIDYDERQYSVYARGRAMSPAMTQTWMKAFADRVPARRPLAVLDLGCGTGRFTPALARTFGGPVYGIEPSRQMRDIAVRSSAHPGVTYLAGSAEDIPRPASAARLRLRAISTFEYLTHEETEQGFAALDRAVAAETSPRSVEGDSDLLVLG
jgi:ubiquinone/menaquinone biosynthesis C-methylase UbiE